VNPTSAEVWRTLIRSDKIKVGIRWAGNPKFEHQQFRLFPHQFLTTLNRYKELQIYSFQRDNHVVDLPADIEDLQHLLISWEDTLGALDQMDLIITSCTSVAHAAAAIGKPTWVVTPILPYHTWAWGAPESTVSPYYTSTKIYRQQKPREWKDTFLKVYEDLEAHFNLEHQEANIPITDTKIKINLGCGVQKIDGFVNIDVRSECEPDKVMDLMQFPWDLPDDSVDHIVAKDILEHVGHTHEDLVRVLQEMYRVSCDGAAWEVQYPHHRCDLAVDDPTHVRLLTQNTFRLFDQDRAKKLIELNQAETPLAIMHDVDIEVCDVKHEWVPYWSEKVRAREMTEEQLYFNLNHMNNVAQSVMLLIQVHKPGRARMVVRDVV
jgi:hypothetical protein